MFQKIRLVMRRLRLKTKFFLFLLFVVVVVVAAISAVSSTLYLEKLRENALSSCDELLEIGGARVGVFMHDIDTMSYALMYNRTVQNVLNVSERASLSLSTLYSNQRNLYYALLLQASINPSIEISFHPLNRGERSFYSEQASSVSADYDFTTAQWYRNFQENPGSKKQYIINGTQEYRLSTGREKAHIVAYPVMSITSFSQIGYMCVYIYENTFGGILSGLSDSIQNLLLVSDADNGIVLSLGTEIAASDLEKLSNEDGNIVSLNGKSYILMRRQIDGTPWSIIGSYELSDMQAQSRWITLVIFGLAITLVMASATIIWRFTAKMLLPIEEMAIGMECVKIGRFDFQLPETGQDELGQLLSSMNAAIRQLNEANANIKTLSALQRESGLKALRQQINPHFLYNTLNMLMGMASENENAAIIEVCKSLSEMFRYNLNGGHMVSLREELAQTRRYVQISQYRFRDLFTVEYYVSEALLGQRVPKMILQPLVENSVIHGFAESGKQGVLTISVAKIPGDRMLICVKDTGCGMLKNDLNVLRDSMIDTGAFPGEWAHIGLNNVFARLRMEYGTQVEFDIDSHIDVGTQITITLPIRGESEG